MSSSTSKRELTDDDNKPSTSSKRPRQNCGGSHNLCNTSMADANYNFISKANYTEKAHSHQGDIISGPGAMKMGNVENLNYTNKPTYQSTYITYSSQTSVQKDTSPSVKQLKKIQLKYEEECFLLDIDKTSYDNIKNIFPKMMEVPFSDEDAIFREEEYKPSLKNTYLHKTEQSIKVLKFQDILSKTKQCKVLNLIGLPGQGKSTFCKRVIKSFCNDSNSLCILVKFMNLNFDPPDEKITLQELLIDNNYPDLEPEECKSAFKWILKNEENLLLIFDGYDQANWSIKQKSPQRHYSKSQPVWDLVSNIVNKKYLSKSHVIFTSRPHAMKTLPKYLRQNFTVQLLDLSSDDMQSLFLNFAGTKAVELWEKLHTKAPHLVSLCGSPLILQLVIIACIDPTSDVVNLTTMTRLFFAVFDHLNSSVHSECMNIQELLPLLTKLAFIATKCGRVRMTEEDLERIGLNVSLIRHLIISQQTGGFCHLFEGKEIFYFIHQTLQEYLTALYIAKYMSDEEFRRFCINDLFSSHWDVVRQFLFGITFDLLKNAVNQEWKVSLMMGIRLQRMNIDKKNLIETCKEVRECADEEITEAAARQFPTEAVLAGIRFSNSDAHAVSLVLRKVKTKIQYFSLNNCRLNSQTFSYFVRAIKVMEGSIDRLGISRNKLTSDDVDEICDILSKINVGLFMGRCFVDEQGTGMSRSASEEEKAKILAKQNSLGHSNLRFGFDSVNVFRDILHILRVQDKWSYEDENQHQRSISNIFTVL